MPGSRRKFILIAVVLLALAGSYLAKNHLQSQNVDSRASSSENGPSWTPCGIPYKRIVSMAPSITETLFALGLGDRVVGVTRYCDFPTEALKKDKIGGFFDPNYEAILAMEPDLIVMLPEHRESRQYLARFDLNMLVVNHQDIPGILDSINNIGMVCGNETKARSIVVDLEKRVNTIQAMTRGLPRPRTMISVGRTMGTGSLEEVYIAGREGFYDRMIEWAGGTNAYNGKAVRYPVVSAEGILGMNPEVVIDMVSDIETNGLRGNKILKDWESVPELDAVKKRRIHIFREDFVVIPGPRFILTLEKMARAIHPEINWPF